MKLPILSLVLLATLCLATDKPKIRQLNENNLAQFAKDNSYWLIQISKGKCPECTKQEKELEAVAYMLEGIVKVGKIDAKLIPSLKIQHNPTYMFTRSDEPEKSTPFQGTFQKKQIAKFCLGQLSEYIKKRAGSSSSSTGSSSSSDKSSGKSHSKGSSSQSSRSSSTVIELNDKVFEDKVLKSSDAWLVEFYSPGCGHCRNFEPQYSKLPGLIGKRVHISRVDGSKNQQYMGKYQVKGFPTVLLFDTDDKSQPIPYNGQRTAQAVVAWLKTQKINQQKKQLLELTKANYNHECNRNIICLIFILNKKSEKSKLKFLEEMIEEHKDKPFRFFYSERLYEFQSQLMIDDRDAPKLVSVWDSLNSYRIYNGKINHDDLDDYLKTILERKGWIKYQNKFNNALFPVTNTDL